MEHAKIMEKCLGVDPGLANTGFAVVTSTRRGYALLDSGLIRTPSSEPEPERLKAIYDRLREILEVEQPSWVCIELCFHNKNVSSSMQTAGVIGVVKLLAVQFGATVHVVTPQQVKAASGLGGSAKKRDVQKMMGKIFGKPELLNNHVADAAAAGIAGILSKGGETP